MLKYLANNIVFLFISITLIFAATSCEEKKAARPNTLDSHDLDIQPDQVAQNFNIRFIDSNWTRAILKGKRGRVFSSRSETLIDGGLRLELFNKSQALTTWLIADSARIDDNSHDMYAFGNIVVFSDSTITRLETSFLHWSHSQQKFFSNVFVRITSPSEIIEGFGFESDQHLKNYKIYKVSGVKQ